MWIWVILIAIAIGAVVGYVQSEKGEDAVGGAMVGGCLAAGCLLRLALVALGILLVLWLFGLMFG